MRLEMQLKRRPLESTETDVLNLNNLMPYGTYNFSQIQKVLMTVCNTNNYWVSSSDNYTYGKLYSLFTKFSKKN
jgi:hypothetical protein